MSPNARARARARDRTRQQTRRLKRELDERRDRQVIVVVLVMAVIIGGFVGLSLILNKDDKSAAAQARRTREENTECERMENPIVSVARCEQPAIPCPRGARHRRC